MSPRTLIPSLTLIVLLAAGLAGCTQPADNGEHDNAAKDTSPIPIGLLMPLTGQVAGLGVPAAQGVRLAVAEINDAGGVDGRMLNLVEGDTKFPDTAEAVSAFQRLQGDGVEVIIGALASDSSEAVKSQADSAKVVLISPASTRPSLTGADHGYFFRTIANDDVQGPQAADLLYTDLGHASAVVMYQQNGYAQGLKDVFMPAYEDLDGAVIGDPISWTSDEAAMAGKAAEAAAHDPPFVWIAGQAPEIASLISELRDAGYAGGIMASEAIESSEIFDVGGDAVDGVYFTKSSPDLASPAFTDFLAAYEAEYGTSPGPFDVYAYDATYVAAAAMAAVGNDGEKVREWMLTNTVDGRVSTNAISFFQGDVTSGGYTLWQIQGDAKAFTPAQV